MATSLPDNVKSGKWIFREWEDRLRPFLAKYVPANVGTHHLTLMTLVWSFGVVLSGYLAQFNMQWLWLSSLMIVCQYITDLLDGTIGRLRNTGLVKWGYYMDHFLDYIFFTALILSYAYIFPSSENVVLVIIALIQIGFMVNIFLAYGSTSKLEISFAGFGPTEIRLLYIIFNIFLIFFGIAVPVALIAPFAIIMGTSLVVNVYLTQKAIWKLDMASIESQQKAD
jgi:phosphatidylglycerophosphate synthase